MKWLNIMPSHRIRYLTKVLEIFVLGTTLALLSHVSVNFWERYVIQTELGRMKSSLQVLKSTVNNIGEIYSDLFTEVRCLGDKKTCNPKKLLSNNPNNEKGLGKTKSTVHQLLEDLGVGVNNGFDFGVDVKPDTYEFGIDARPKTYDISINTQQDINFNANPKFDTVNFGTKNNRKKIFRNESTSITPSPYYVLRKKKNPKHLLLKTIKFNVPDFADADTHTHNNVEVYTTNKPYYVIEIGKGGKIDPTEPTDQEHYYIYSTF